MQWPNFIPQFPIPFPPQFPYEFYYKATILVSIIAQSKSDEIRRQIL